MAEGGAVRWTFVPLERSSQGRNRTRENNSRQRYCGERMPGGWQQGGRSRSFPSRSVPPSGRPHYPGSRPPTAVCRALCTAPTSAGHVAVLATRSQTNLRSSSAGTIVGLPSKASISAATQEHVRNPQVFSAESACSANSALSRGSLRSSRLPRLPSTPGVYSTRGVDGKGLRTPRFFPYMPQCKGVAAIWRGVRWLGTTVAWGEVGGRCGRYRRRRRPSTCAALLFACSHFLAFVGSSRAKT